MNMIAEVISYTRSSDGKVTNRNYIDTANTLHSVTGGGGNTDQFLRVKSAKECGYEEAGAGDSINLTAINSTTRRGRVGKQKAQTLDTLCEQAVVEPEYKIRRLNGRLSVRGFRDFLITIRNMDRTKVKSKE